MPNIRVWIEKGVCEMRTLVIGGTHRRKLVSNILWCRTWSGFFFRLRFDLFLIIFRFLCFVWPKISKMLNLYVIKLTAYLWKKNCCFWNLKKKPSHLKKKIKKKSVKKGTTGDFGSTNTPAMCGHAILCSMSIYMQSIQSCIGKWRILSVQRGIQAIYI